MKWQRVGVAIFAEIIPETGLSQVFLIAVFVVQMQK